MLSLLAATKKPKPVTFRPSTKSMRTEEYRLVAERLGIKTPTDRTETLGLMHERGIEVYDLDAVNRFMDKLSLKSDVAWCWVPLRNADMPPDIPDFYRLHTGLGRSRFLLASGLLFAVEAACLGTLVSHTSLALFVAVAAAALCFFVSFFFLDYSGFHVSVGYTTGRQGTYNKPVPLQYLKQVELLAQALPALQFYVSDYAVPDPDPFIMCTTHTGWRIVFGTWDEPTFGT